MKSPRSSAALAVLVVVLLAWLVVRSRFSSPPPSPATDSVATPSVGPTTPGIPATRTPSPSVPTPQNTTTPAPNPPPTASEQPTSPTASPPVAPTGTVAINSATTTASSSDSATINAIKVRRMITDYHTLTGENPVGTNAEIMAATMGKNPRQAVVGPPEGLGLNSKGELVDEWGTPYFFHQLSKDLMEIHSAGPDKIMGTADDVIVR